MKILSALYFLFICCSNLKAQVIQETDLQKFSWFTDNSAKNFYTSDTISLISIVDTFSEYLKLNRQYRELDYNKNSNITKIEFKRRNKLVLYDVDIKSWTNIKLTGKWKWRFDFDTQLISFYFDKKLHSVFDIKEKSSDTLIKKYNDSNSNSKEEVYHLLILTLIRRN
jgi:hypothetical protein